LISQKLSLAEQEKKKLKNIKCSRRTIQHYLRNQWSMSIERRLRSINQFKKGRNCSNMMKNSLALVQCQMKMKVKNLVPLEQKKAIKLAKPKPVKD
jgi:hypothetical protein